MMFMRTVLALCLATFTLAAPVAEPPLDDLVSKILGAFCLSQYALLQA
jgi:hypothetical protein